MSRTPSSNASAYARERLIELAALTDRAVVAKVRDLGLVLSTFADL